MSSRTRRSTALSSTPLFRASQDQDFDPFSSPGSSQRRTAASARPSASSSNPAARRALAEETNTSTANMKQSTSQLELSRARGFKRSTSQMMQDYSTPSSSRHTAQATPGSSNGLTNGTNGINGRSTRAQSREPSSSPAKRRRAGSSAAPAANGSARPQRDASVLNGLDDDPTVPVSS